MGNILVVMLSVTGVFLLLALGMGLLLRGGLFKMIGFRRGRGKLAALDAQVDTLMLTMGERMERPWMTQELQVVSGLDEERLSALMSRAQKRNLIRREWKIHPVTGEEYQAALLSRAGVRKFGMYAPDGSDSPEPEDWDDSGEQADLSPVRVSDFLPTVEAEDERELETGAAPLAQPSGIQPRGIQPRGIRGRR